MNDDEFYDGLRKLSIKYGGYRVMKTLLKVHEDACKWGDEISRSVRT